MSPAVFNRRGFTVIELIVVLAIFVLSATVTLPFLGAFQQTENLKTVSQDVLHILRRAQQRTMSGQRDESWSVEFRPGAFTLFRGASFTARNEHFDEEHHVPLAFAFSGFTVINFLRPSGTPRTPGSLTILHPSGISTRITVNAAGGIFLEE